MWRFICIAVALSSSCAFSAVTKSGLYYKTFGDPQNVPILFVHGGPGYNSWSFEHGAAPQLAEAGFYVVVFDQRGSGRSASGNSGDYTFANASKDILEVMQASHCAHPILLGHSWGGTPAIEFLKLHPGVARAVILLEAPMSWPGLLRTMILNSEAVFESRGDSKDDQDARGDMVKMFPNGLSQPFNFSLAEIADVFTFALLKAGIYFPTRLTSQAKGIYSQLESQPDSHWMRDAEDAPVIGFYANEKFYDKNFTNDMAANANLVYAIYSNEDGLFDPIQIGQIEGRLPDGHFISIAGAGHYSFLDQRDSFIRAVKSFAADISNPVNRRLYFP